MTTQQFIQTIDFSKEIKSMESISGVTESSENISWIKLSTMFKSYCSLSLVRDSFGKSASYYKINNEEVVNYLRDLWLESNNQFVKNVIVTVGKERKFTEKQIDIIMKEAVKFDVELRFKN